MTIYYAIYNINIITMYYNLLFINNNKNKCEQIRTKIVIIINIINKRKFFSFLYTKYLQFFS